MSLSRDLFVVPVLQAYLWPVLLRKWSFWDAAGLEALDERPPDDHGHDYCCHAADNLTIQTIADDLGELEQSLATVKEEKGDE